MIYDKMREMLKDIDDSIFQIENHGDRHDDAMRLNQYAIQKALLTELLTKAKQQEGEVKEVNVKEETWRLLNEFFTVGHNVLHDDKNPRQFSSVIDEYAKKIDDWYLLSAHPEYTIQASQSQKGDTL